MAFSFSGTLSFDSESSNLTIMVFDPDMTQKKLAEMTGIAPSVLNEVLNGKRSVTTEYALLIEAVLGIDADIWIGLQADYDKQKARHDASFIKRLEEIRKYAALL